eukprot:1717804-Rhodomonas_salina.2
MAQRLWRTREVRRGHVRCWGERTKKADWEAPSSLHARCAVHRTDVAHGADLDGLNNLRGVVACERKASRV